MMLGIRESVGGANGVDDELEAKLWEDWECGSCTSRRFPSGMIMELEEEETGMMMRGNKDDSDSRSEMGRKKKNVTLGLLGRDGEEGGERRQGEEEEEEEEEEEIKQDQQQQCELVLGPLTISRVENVNINDSLVEQDDDDDNNDEQQQQQAILEQQCARITKYKFSPSTFYLGSNKSEPLPHKYKFKVYAPVVFQRIRTLFGVEKQTFLHSICGKFNLYEFASNAKSGQVRVFF